MVRYCFEERKRERWGGERALFIVRNCFGRERRMSVFALVRYFLGRERERVCVYSFASLLLLLRRSLEKTERDVTERCFLGKMLSLSVRRERRSGKVGWG